MSQRNAQRISSDRQVARSSCCETPDRAQRLSRGSGRIHQLARRTAGLATDLRPLQPVLPHGRSRGGRAATRSKLLSYLASTASRASPSTRPSSSSPCTPDGYVIGDVILFHLAENQFNLVGRARRITGSPSTPRPAGTTSRSSSTSGPRCAPTGAARLYRFQMQGPNAMKVIEKVHRQDRAGTQVLPHDDAQDRAARTSARCATAWPASRLGAVRAMGRRRGGARSARRGRRRVRPAAGGRPGLLVQHPGVRLDSLAAAGGLFRRRS